MPRNAAGVYTLPDPPRVPNTVIDSPDENVTRDDIATELTNSLDRNGRGGMLAPFRIADGTLAAPGLAFLNEPGTGIWRQGAGDMRIAVQGAEYMRFAANTVTIPAGVSFVGSGTFKLADGALATPSLAFINEVNTGLWRAGPGDMSVAVLGVDIASFGVTGMTIPAGKTFRVLGQILLTDGAVGAPSLAFINDTNSGLYRAGLQDIRMAVNGVDKVRYATTGVIFDASVTVQFNGGRLTFGNIVNGEIIMNTVDGADDRALSICGGGAISQARGAAAIFYGNEHAGTGVLQLSAGDVANGVIRLFAGGTEQVRINRLPGAVNFLTLTGGTVGSNVSIVADGADANVALSLASRGTNPINFYTNSAVTPQFIVLHTAGSNRVLTVTGSNGGMPVLGTSGGSDISIQGTINVSRNTDAYHAFFTRSFNGVGDGIGIGSAPGIGRITSNGAACAIVFELNAQDRARFTPNGVFKVNAGGSSGLLGGSYHEFRAFSGNFNALQIVNDAGNGAYTFIVWNSANIQDNVLVAWLTETGGSLRGSVDFNRAGGVIRYNTTSDVRQKNILGDAKVAVSKDILLKTRMREYSWKDDPTQKPQVGPIAQELYASGFRGAVTVGTDEVNEHGNLMKPWGVDRTAFVNHLVVGWQDHEARIAALEGKI